MRVMVIVKANAESEAGTLPTTEALVEMGKYNDELIAAGVMVDGGGLQSSRAGKRVQYSARGIDVIDGPFTETKELIAGYWIWNVASMEDAVAWAKKAPFKDTHIDLRPYFEPEDFAGVAPPEMIEEEKGWREAQLAKAPKGA